MPADLIVYALVAAGLVFWLRSILGTRHGDERERPDPFVSRTENSGDLDLEPLFSPKDETMSREEEIAELAQNPSPVVSIQNKAAETGLLEIAGADKSFEIKSFLDGAQDAFVIIVEAFAEGDRETLGELLSEDVYRAFDAAISERESKGETQETEIHAIRGAEIIEAKVEAKSTYITIRFVADETSVTRDKENKIISGHPDKVTEMHDIWVLGREIRSRDPSWLVYETRGDFDGDNETVPNSD